MQRHEGNSDLNISQIHEGEEDSDLNNMKIHEGEGDAFGDSDNTQMHEGDGDSDAFDGWSISIQEKMNKTPMFMKTWAGQDSCFIFRAPQALNNINENAYKPHIISIGPYHHGKDDLKMMEEHKWRYLRAHIDRTGETYTQRLRRYYEAIGSLEGRIRECYSEEINYNREQLLEIMVFDGCFLIELFTIFDQYLASEVDDPLFNASWVRPHLMRDLLLLENQIPFFVLEKLFGLSLASFWNGTSIESLALNFFCDGLTSSRENINGTVDDRAPKHLLNLLHCLFHFPLGTPSYSASRKLSPSASKLLAVGVKLRSVNDRSFLDVKFKNNILEIPRLVLDEISASLLLNCVAFEMCFTIYPHPFIDYVSFINSLVRTPGDAAILSERNIIENLYGSYEEIASFFSTVNKQVPIDVEYNYLFQVLDDVNTIAEESWHRHWAEFKHKYLRSPWVFISAFAAAVLLSVSIIQTAFTILQYFDHSK